MLPIYGLFTNTPANHEKNYLLAALKFAFFKMVTSSSMIKWPQ